MKRVVQDFLVYAGVAGRTAGPDLAPHQRRQGATQRLGRPAYQHNHHSSYVT